MVFCFIIYTGSADTGAETSCHLEREKGFQWMHKPSPGYCEYSLLTYKRFNHIMTSNYGFTHIYCEYLPFRVFNYDHYLSVLFQKQE